MHLMLLTHQAQASCVATKCFNFDRDGQFTTRGVERVTPLHPVPSGAVPQYIPINPPPEFDDGYNRKKKKKRNKRKHRY